MEIDTETLAGGVVLLLIQIGLLITNHFRQRQAKRDIAIERERKDDAMKATLTNALIANNDKTAKSLEDLRSMMEENEARHKEELVAIEKRHKEELAGRDTVIRNLEKDIKDQLTLGKNERDYYRETINQIRQDSRDAVKAALNAQGQAEQVQQQNEVLTSDNKALNTTVIGQRETIIQLEVRLNALTQERNELQKHLESLQALRQENEQLKAEIAALTALIEEKNTEITHLKAEINRLTPNINATMVLTAPESAIRHPEGSDPL